MLYSSLLSFLKSLHSLTNLSAQKSPQQGPTTAHRAKLRCLVLV